MILTDVLSYFLIKKMTQQIVRETYRNVKQYKKARGSFFSFRSFVRSWTPVRINKIYSFMSVLRGTVKEREKEREKYQQWHLPV